MRTGFHEGFRGGFRGFTLLETAAVMVMVSLLVGVLTPAVRQARTDTRGAQSAANLAFIGQGTAMYAADHEGRLFTYNWGPGQYVMPDGTTRMANNDQTAATLQNAEILMRRTGRISGPERIQIVSSILPHRRDTHLVLMDYLDLPFPSDIFADPADANLLGWQANPLDLSAANNIPYAPGWDSGGYGGSGGSYTLIGARQRWAYSSSYQRTVSAWNTDGLNGEGTYAPTASTPHLFQTAFGGPQNLAAGRTFDQVAFPSAKVHMFEEFDRRSFSFAPYFGYDIARPAKLMFDGSINLRRSGEANPSWSPASIKLEWRQTYVPLHTFPVPLSGLGETTLVSQRYRWTMGGLRGIDYGAPLMGR
ncbi:MAG: type II secretion system GspH family protein [Phycisphaerales bacterium]|nr:type II secretion system protein [Planctomycetota bacterium]MCH8508409.1 type II secretion system GspH family protein [Phycisphaerales bacterium]